jgi:hypothetical protein
MKLGYIFKTSEHGYALTAVGKELANNLDEAARSVQKQPKLSVLLVIPRHGGQDNDEFLFQQRLRQPFYDYWGCLSGPVQWGEDIEVTASRELLKQTGLKGSCAVRSFYRAKDYQLESGVILEDKLFVVVQVSQLEGTLSNAWTGGGNQWMTTEQLQAQQKYFLSSAEVVETVQTDQAYTSRNLHYKADGY